MKTKAALKATALIGAAVVLALLTVQGTLALWSASVETPAQSVQSADFTVLVTTSGKQQRLPANGSVEAAGPAGLKPGESRTTPIVVTNQTDAGGAFTVKATADNPALRGELAPHLTTSIGLGRDGTCTTVQEGRSMDLAKGASGTFCLTTTMAGDTPATIGGAGATIAFALTTTQQP